MKKKIKAKLKDITSQVEPVPNTKAIDDATTYSFQYNLKIVGVPQKNERETAEETTMLCLKIFSKIGVNVSENDIDIAHITHNMAAEGIVLLKTIILLK